MIVRFSLVIPVHDEANMLPLTLTDIRKLKANEVIFVLDRCTDSTEKIIRDFWKKYDSGARLVLLRIQRESRWRMHLNFLYDIGIRKAESKIVLLSQADILHDYGKINRNIKDALHGMVSFAVSEHPHVSPWNHFITRVLQRGGGKIGIQRFSGVIALNKKGYLKKPLKPNDPFLFDTQLQQNFPNYKFQPSRNLNLRPWVKNKLWMAGLHRYQLGKPLWKPLLFSMLRLTPKFFAGYAYAKWRKHDATA
jgi:glycosyltransferase involved in cell wall biosynthesis